MNIQILSRMPFSPEAAWPELAKVDSHVTRIFLSVVVPLSLLPPAMAYMAGAHHGDAFLTGLSSKQWGHVALIFFLCELVSVALMGWLVKAVASTWSGEVSYRNAYLLAAIAPVPLWFSSLGLLVPSLGFNVLVSLVALCLSCALTYQGVRGFCKIREEVEAAAITQIVFGAGMLVWGVLLSLLVIVPG